MKKNKNFVLMFVWGVIFSSLPFTFSSYTSLNYKVLGSALTLIFIIGLLFYILRAKRVLLPSRLLQVVLFVAVILHVLLGIWHADASYLTVSVSQIIVSAIVFVSILTFVGTERFALSYCYVLFVFSLLAIISFFVALSGIFEPFLYNNPDGRNARHYLFGTSNVNWPLGEGYFIRVSSFFDEPGQFAVFISFALIFNQMVMRSKAFEAVYVVAGVLTFSLYFFAFVMMYYSVRLLFAISGDTIKKKNIVTFGQYAIVFCLSLVVSGALLAYASLGDGFEKRIAQVTFDRISVSEKDDRVFQGDNRTRSLNSAVSIWLNKPFLGVGRSMARDPAHPYHGEPVGTHFVRPFAQSGILGGLANYAIPLTVFGLFVFTLFGRGRLRPLDVIIILSLLLIFLHRPNTTMVFMALSLYVFVEYFQGKEFNRTKAI